MNGTSRPCLRFSSAIGAQVGNRLVEIAALAVLHVGLLRRAVDRERHLVDAGMDEAPGPVLGERQAVRARVEIDVRELAS